MPSAILALEDGSVFEGRSFGASAERSGEVVFNTAITGYQEIFTDPSYSGQIVILTNPANRELRNQRPRQRIRAPLHRGTGGARVFQYHQQLALRRRSPRVSEQARHSGCLRAGHARAGAPSAHPRRDARRAFSHRNRRRQGWSKRRARSPPWRDSIWPAASPPQKRTLGTNRSSRARLPNWCRRRPSRASM